MYRRFGARRTAALGKVTCWPAMSSDLLTYYHVRLFRKLSKRNFYTDTNVEQKIMNVIAEYSYKVKPNKLTILK